MTTATTTKATYLGILDGEHRWDDGTRLPLLYGFDDPDDDEPDEDDDTGDDGDEDDPIPDDKTIKDPIRARSARQAARYRNQRNDARAERDEARMEVAYLRAANGQVVDTAAGWKLLDKSLIVVNDDGTIDAEAAVNSLIVDNPFLEISEPEAKEPANPFRTASTSSGRSMNSRKKNTNAHDTRALEQKYPALRGRR